MISLSNFLVKIISLGSYSPEVRAFAINFTSTKVSMVIICQIHRLRPPAIHTKTILDAVGNGLW